MNVEYSSAAPSELNSEMNPSATPLNVVCIAPGVRGKVDELVVPVIHTLPTASGATPAAPDDPPMSVDHSSCEAVGFSFVTNVSLPVGVVSYAPGVVGKSSDAVPPDT